MAKKAFPKRYAQALFEIAREKGDLEAWEADLNKLAPLGANTALLNILAHPKLRFEDKAKLVSDIIGDMRPMVQSLVMALITSGKLGIIGKIAAEYKKLLDKHYGIARAEVMTAVPLDEEENKSVAEVLSRITGKTVIVTPKVDGSILGGIVGRIDGKLLDGSTRTKLIELKQRLARAGS